MSHDEMYEAALQGGEFSNGQNEFGQAEYAGEWESGEFQGEQDESDEMFAQEFGVSGESGEAGESGEYGLGESGEAGEYGQEYSGEAGEAGESGELNESEEIALAAELLEVADEDELDQFLGKLIKRAAGVARGVLATPAGGALKGLLRSAAKRALPLAGQAIGGYFGGSTGAKIGDRLGGAAGRLFGLEVEGLSREDQEYEVARQFVRFASNAARQLPPRATPAQARNTFLNVARRMAPGLARNFGRGLGQGLVAGSRPYRGPYPPNGRYPQPASPTQSSPQAGPGRRRPSSGQWVRQGNRITLIGV